MCVKHIIEAIATVLIEERVVLAGIASLARVQQRLPDDVQSATGSTRRARDVAATCLVR